MKKCMTFILTALLFLSCAVPAFAEEAYLNDEQMIQEIGVYVKYVDNTEWNTISTDENGKGTDKLPDSTEIEISGADKSKGNLIIDPITDKEALAWIGSVTDGKAKTSQAFHIYYLYDNGNITEADGVTVTVKPKDMPQNAVVYSLDTDGKATLLEFAVKDGAVTFTANGDPYYVIGEKVGTSTAPGDNVPQTGDNGRLGLWITMANISTATLIFLFFRKRRKAEQ